VSADSDELGEALLAFVAMAIRRNDRELSLTATSTLSTLERTGPRRLTDLAMNEEITQPSMTALVTQLQERGFVERRSDPGDARVVLVAITEGGLKQLRKIRRAGAAVLAGLIDKLEEPDLTALKAALPALRRLPELADEPGSGRITR